MILVGFRRSFMSIAGVGRSSAFDRDNLVRKDKKSIQTRTIVSLLPYQLELGEDRDFLPPSEIRENRVEWMDYSDSMSSNHSLQQNRVHHLHRVHE